MSFFLVPGEAEWRIPAYAQDMLWVTQGDQMAQASGARGSFALPAGLMGTVYLVWGTPDGALLASWPDPNTVHWAGTVGVGGFVERLHVFEAHGLELVVVEIEGTALPPGYGRLPTLAQMRSGPFRRVPASEPDTARQYTYTFIAQADSVHAEYLHHAMVSELAVDCFATLGPQAGQWHTITGLPLLLDSVTLLAPGYR